MEYRFLEHTADVRAECRGATFAELLEAGAGALYDVAFRHMEDRTDCRRLIFIETSGPEETVVQWLQELIYLMEAERFAARKFVFTRADAHGVEAEVQGYEYEPKEREEEIKAATYHGMKVRHDANGWRVEVLFDL